MTTLYAKDYGVIPGREVAKELNEMFASIKELEGEKKLIFESGEYTLLRQNCPYIYRAITNTSAAEEYENPDEVFMHYAAFLIEDVDNLKIEGNGALFTIDGKATNAVISSCKNLTIKNLKIDTKNPGVHKLTVTKNGLLHTDFELDSESEYTEENGKLTWVGNGHRLGFTQFSGRAFWTSTIKPNNPDNIRRTSHPFMGAVKVREIFPRNFRVKFPLHKPFKKGQEFYVFNAHRSDVGIFAENCVNLTLSGIEQYFNYSLALVLQDCTDVTLEKSRFAPRPGSERRLASLADFIQACMCSGKITVTDCLFDGAADDALNVHGVHYAIENIGGRELTAVYKHPQTWGFNPLHAGDEIEFINPETMLPVGKNKIVSSELTGARTIRLTLENEIPAEMRGTVIEDISRCPELYFANNTLNRIITRAILYTSRGKCVIENNRFINNTMSGILLSDDAKSWFESGLCRDVTIRNNEFCDCGGTPILILPENSVHKGAVHSNIKIIGNTFKKYRGACIKIKSASGVVISDNKFSGKAFVSENSSVTAEY